MKAKIKEGHEHLFTAGASNDWSDLKDEMIINFADKYSCVHFIQQRNHLYLVFPAGLVDIVFTGEVPKLSFGSYNKDQLILKITKA